MNDKRITDHIESLVDEEQRLHTAEQHDASDDDQFGTDRERLAQISVELDQCWDLLRRRRALREVGQNPDDAQLRDSATVEHYQQ